MVGMAADAGRPPPYPAPHPTVSLQAHEMEHIRNVFDEDSLGKKFSCIASPREDAQMFRNTERHAIPCQCITEIYELLWRWGHRNQTRNGFAENYGFCVPDTVVIVKGRPYAWYFISQKDGTLMRKSDANLSLGQVEKKFCRERKDDETPIAATWLPMASQFAEARCHVPYAEFLTVTSCRKFLSDIRQSHSGILQAFVDPHGVSNFLIRTVQYREQTSLCVRTNRALLDTAAKGNPFDKAATFEGWPGLSSTASRYRSHKHPLMEEQILQAGERLNARIESERVRQMLFLGPTEHVALHFKVTKEHMLYFVYASVVSEKDVILQTRPQLLMGDPCMTEVLHGAALLPGGTDMKAVPYRGPKPGSRTYAYDEDTFAREEDEAHQSMGSGGPASERLRALQEGSFRREMGSGGGSLPPRVARANHEAAPYDSPRASRRIRSEKKRLQGQSIAEFIPQVGYPRPYLPEAPYKILDVPPSARDQSDGTLGSLKRPLIFPTSARSMLEPQSARSLATSARSEPPNIDGYGRPPVAPD